MGTPQCQQCESDRVELDLGVYSNFRTTGEIEEKYRNYAQSNLLGMYSVRVQRNIQKLYTLGQTQLCDRIIFLSCSKKDQVRDRLLDDLQSIDLEELDHLALIEALPKKVQATYSAISSGFYDEDELSLAKTTPNLRQTELKKSSNMRMFSKNVLREQMRNKSQYVLENNKFFVVGTVGCFEELDSLAPLALPTRKSALRMFLEKIEANNYKYQSSLLVFFIVSPECEEQFDKELSAFEFQMNQQQSQIDEFSLPFKFQKILYKPHYPCVDHNRKIKLNSNDEILFNYKGGDLVGFIMKHPRLQGMLHKYEIMQVANISNILENIGDPDILAYLKDNIQIDIVAPTVSDPNAFSVHRMNRLFVQWIPISAKQPGQKQHQLTHTFYVRSLLLTNKTSHFHKLLSTRIKSQSDRNEIITFSRSFEHILYAPITLFLLTSKSEFAVNKREVVYSNYSKKILGITDTKQQQIVEICPQMLFGDKGYLLQFVDKLLLLPEAGFPLVLARQKLELRHSRPVNK